MSATNRPVHASDPSDHLLIVSDELLSVAEINFLIAGVADDDVVAFAGVGDHLPRAGLGVGVGAAVATAPVTDAIKQVDADGLVVDTLDRSQLCCLATPVLIRVGVVRRCLADRGDGERVDPLSLVGAALVVAVLDG